MDEKGATKRGRGTTQNMSNTSISSSQNKSQNGTSEEETTFNSPQLSAPVAKRRTFAPVTCQSGNVEKVKARNLPVNDSFKLSDSIFDESNDTVGRIEIPSLRGFRAKNKRPLSISDAQRSFQKALDTTDTNSDISMCLENPTKTTGFGSLKNRNRTKQVEADNTKLDLSLDEDSDADSDVSAYVARHIKGVTKFRKRKETQSGATTHKQDCAQEKDSFEKILDFTPSETIDSEEANVSKHAHTVSKQIEVAENIQENSVSSTRKMDEINAVDEGVEDIPVNDELSDINEANLSDSKREECLNGSNKENRTDKNRSHRSLKRKNSESLTKEDNHSQNLSLLEIESMQHSRSVSRIRSTTVYSHSNAGLLMISHSSQLSEINQKSITAVPIPQKVSIVANESISVPVEINLDKSANDKESQRSYVLNLEDYDSMISSSESDDESRVNTNRDDDENETMEKSGGASRNLDASSKAAQGSRRNTSCDVSKFDQSVEQSRENQSVNLVAAVKAVHVNEMFDSIMNSSMETSERSALKSANESSKSGNEVRRSSRLSSCQTSNSKHESVNLSDEEAASVQQLSISNSTHGSLAIEKSFNTSNVGTSNSAHGYMAVEKSFNTPKVRSSKKAKDVTPVGTSNSAHGSMAIEKSFNTPKVRSSRKAKNATPKVGISNSAHGSMAVEKSFNTPKVRTSSKAKNATPKVGSSKSNMSIGIPDLSELRTSYKRNKANSKDNDLLEELFTFPEEKNTKTRRAQGTGIEKVRKPKLIKPKRWITGHLYKFIIDKLEVSYKINANLRAEKFVTFLVDKVVTVTELNEKLDCKKVVDELKVEMARLNFVLTHHDFNMFALKYLPHSFVIKSVPMLPSCGQEPFVQNLPPELRYSSTIL